jgi:hypothetical protein
LRDNLADQGWESAMHPLSSAQFVVTFALSVTTTTLVSRFIYLVLRRWPIGIEKVAIANGASFAVCWILFVIWCSTGAKIYWMAGHVAFAPQAAWFIYDVLRYDGDGVDEEDQAEMDRLP